MRNRSAKELGPIRVGCRQRQALQQWLKSPDISARERLRALSVLLSAAGQGGESIGAILGTTRRTVTQARTRWRRGGLLALRDVVPPGRPPKATKAYMRRLLHLATSDPRKLGYAFVRWTAPRLAAQMAKETGVRLSAGWVVTLLRTRCLVWRRTKRTIRNLQEPAAVAKAQRRLRRLKRGLLSPTPSMSCGSATG